MLKWCVFLSLLGRQQVLTSPLRLLIAKAYQGLFYLKVQGQTASLIQTGDCKTMLERVVVVSECLIWTLREKEFLYIRASGNLLRLASSRLANQPTNLTGLDLIGLSLANWPANSHVL